MEFLPPTQQKKGPKQATMFSFFSPKKPGQESDENAAESEPKSAGAKRPRATSPAAKSKANSTDKTAAEGKKKTTPSGKAKAKTKPRAKAKGKTKASPKAKAKPRKKRQAPVRFLSPHATADSEDEDDLDEEGDVFNTPEAKRARAELETGGEIVPAGAPISDDTVVEEMDVVDVSGEDVTTTETAATEEDNADGEETASKDDAAAGEGVVDLTAAPAPNSADDEKTEPARENAQSTKVRGKAAKSSATKNTRPATKPLTKRQQKMKEKAAAEVKPAPVEPLDPAIQARVDTYKLKMDELTRRYTELLHSKQESDAITQDIYGAGLDRNLDVSVDHEKAQQVLAETWQKLRDHALSSGSSADAAALLSSTVEIPHEVKALIVKSIQGRTASLSVISSELLAVFKKDLGVDDVDMEATENTRSSGTETVDSAATLALEMDIKMLAQRTPHGVRPAKANVFEDTSDDALWVWEVGNLEKYFQDDAQKTIKRMRKNRKRLGQQLKTLARVIQLLHQKSVDEAKVSAEEAKVGKFGFMIDAELQKAKDRETKEQEKRNAVEEKKRHELERQQAKEAKDEEKRKRERDEEEKKKAVSSKRLKVWDSFLHTATAPRTSEPAIDMTGDEDDEEKSIDAGESKSAKIVRMDAAISFLGSSEGAPSSSPGAVDSSQQSILSLLKGKRDATKRQADNTHPNDWSARRHRDPKLGVMKLVQFYENNRPAYYGTFSSRSPLFHGGRRPLAQYAKFDYTVDSDDEWEEEEPGESLSDAENDAEESDEDDLDYEDKWLAYEDEVDYMDDVEKEDEPRENGEGPLSPTKHKLPSQLQKKRAKAKAVKPAKLEPQIIGPFWCSDNESKDHGGTPFPGLAGELLCKPVFESTLMRKAREYEEEQKRLEGVRQEQLRKKEQQQEQEKLKAQEKKAKGAKQKSEAATSKIPAVKQADKSTPVKSTPANSTPAKSTPAKSTPAKPTPQKTSPAKSTPSKATHQKTKALNESAKPSPSPAQATSAAASASPSPAKAVPQIDSFFKKVTGPVPVPPKSQQPMLQPSDVQQKPKDGSVEVISVD
ncbi:hypothetical protein PHYPSEUDO_006655 [Phytophthora pseudosyringae]|uniref:Chromatin assembly factor 1 subunit A dimerization domain-containing protein n=1 Tax=Phytophthora pseudosyringae TaxID=221518 RepID=A0A8T1WFP0_9STRA|nr:hypothetical protein PHYPSEUDO_006655 [Phytophthora pseudosyringae]